MATKNPLPATALDGAVCLSPLLVSGAFALLLFALLLFTLLLKAPAVWAVEVIEAEPTSVTEQSRTRSTLSTTRDTRSSAPAPVGSTNMAADLYIELQNLRSEVMQLRGLVEQQVYTIEQLQQRRMDDYLEFDRRIAELSGGAAASPSAAPSTSKTPAPAPTTRTTTTPSNPSSSNSPAAILATGDDGKTAYRAAYQLVKDRKFDDAKTALNQFVVQYPGSTYVPNSHFWLGELYYLASNLEQSRQSFTVLVTEFPGHRKVPDAKFKLGKIYHQLGDEKKARTMLDSVLQDHADSKAANPAREYLNNSLR